jgi:hypothetical protein
MRSDSIRFGDVSSVSPSRRESRWTWVSTAIPSITSWPCWRTTLAVFLPTPASSVSSDIVSGTAPSCFSTMSRQADVMYPALLL